MFNKVLVKLTGIFLLSSCISATPATPPGQPGEAKNITGNVDIRPRAYRPYQCDDPFRWNRRECVGILGPRAWQDVCIWNTYTLIYDYKPGNCPEDTTCLDGFNKYGDRFISCISDRTGKAIAGQTGRKKRTSDPQAGTSGVKRGRTEIGNTQQTFSVSVDHDMTGAAVAAVFQSECRTFSNVHRRIFLQSAHVGNQLNLGDDGSYNITPNNVIVGNVHGYQENICHGNKGNSAAARECYPLGTYDFKEGQTIDFTWGMQADQEGKLFYGIIPSLGVDG